MPFNLLTEAWIPVLWIDGQPGRVGIRDALTRAGMIRQIAASNPMDNVALLRFLLAVLHWCKSTRTEGDIALEDAEGIPEEWLQDKLGPGNAAHFNLLGDPPRFFQDKRGALKTRPIGDLLIEFPTETKVAHFQHVRDKEYGFCPACCALGIVRFCAFANYAGKGYVSGLNGSAPAYAVPQDTTLLKTLLLHWPKDSVCNAEPPWLRCDAPTSDSFDVVTAFAWRPRRIWLGQCTDSDRCAHCGQTAPLIRELDFAGGWKSPFAAKGQERNFWERDPHLLLVEKRGHAIDEEDTIADGGNEGPQRRRGRTAVVKRTILGFPRLGHRVSAHTGFWRRALGAAASRTFDGHTVSVVGAATTQTGLLYHDATSVLFRCSEYDGNPASSLGALSDAVARLSAIVRRSTPNPDRQHSNRKAALDALSAWFEADFRAALENSITCGDSAIGILERLELRLARVVEQIVTANTSGSPLRRQEALARAQRLLWSELRRIGEGLQTPMPAPATVEARPPDTCTRRGGSTRKRGKS